MIFKDSEVQQGKGLIPVNDGSGWVHLPTSANSYVLTLDSTQPLGLKWGAAGGSGGGDLTASYIIQTADSNLANAQVLASLATGLVKNTTTTGVLSIASAGTDYLTSVATANINASAVTYAKIQNVGAHALLGNPTGSSAAPSEITLGANLVVLRDDTGRLGGSGSGASTSDAFVVCSTASDCSNSQNLGGLTTGLVKSTVAAGTSTISIATAGTDYLAPTGSAAGLTGLTASQIPTTGLTITEWTGGITTATISSNATTLNFATTNAYMVNLTASTACTVTISNLAVGQQVKVISQQASGAGAGTITWAGQTIRWSGGTAGQATSTAGQIDIFTLYSPASGIVVGGVALPNC